MESLVAQLIPTSRLNLRPIEASYAAELAVVLDDPGLHEFTGGAPESVDRLRARYERWAAGSGRPDEVWLNWAVQWGDGPLVGTMQATAHPIDSPPYAEVAWVIGRPWQGRGIAREAAGAMAAWLRSHGIDRLVAHIHPEHLGSGAVARAIGLRATEVVVDSEIEWVSD